jgi:basic membrane lipoprotein Med (substrate-binding protein (PBP1-ABC) superfamily)
LNAFTLGAQSVNPDVTVHAIMYGSYFYPPAARQATEALIASGVDVITGYQMEPTTYQVAEAAGVWAMGGQEGTGIEGSRLSFAPTKFVTCLNEHYEGYLIKRIQMALDGTWVGNKQLTMLPIGEEGVDLCEFGPNVPQEVIDKVREVRQKFIDGEFKILGPIYNNKGNIVIADGVELTDNEFWMGLEWVAQGVKGMEE